MLHRYVNHGINAFMAYNVDQCSIYELQQRHAQYIDIWLNVYKPDYSLCMLYH